MSYLTISLLYNTENSELCSQLFRPHENLGMNSPKLMWGMSLNISPAPASARQSKHTVFGCGGTQQVEGNASKLKPAHTALTSFTGDMSHLEENGIQPV